MHMLSGIRNYTLLLATVGLLASCSKMKKNANSSSVTGWAYNDKKTAGSFSVAKPKNIKTGPGLVFIQGGTFTMGSSQEDVMMDWNNIPKRVTVNSFFMDKTEVANVHYREYIYWIENTFQDEKYKQMIDEVKPDTLVWRSELAYNEPYVEYYFRHPSYNYYPVVGVTWKQAYDFCLWRTDRVNEKALVDEKVFDKKDYLKANVNNRDEENFNTKSYLMGLYSPKTKSKNRKYVDAKGKPRPVKFDDGVLYGDYRLPTEAEWEYAAYGYYLQNPQKRRSEKNRGEEVIANKQIYAWANDGYDNLRSTRRGAFQGAFLANFKRGSGDNMGVAGGLNDRSAIPAQIDAFYPNGFGIYNMSGNVSEWVADVYRPLTAVDGDDFNYFRGNIFKKVKRDSTGEATKDSLGRVIMVNEVDSVLRKRRNYQKSYAIDYLDGDSAQDGRSSMYNYGVTSLISDKSRVIKGGSWNDRPYWLSPGTRRFLEEDQSSSTIGFRCAMTHYGAPEGTKAATKTGNFFPSRKQKR